MSDNPDPFEEFSKKLDPPGLWAQELFFGPACLLATLTHKLTATQKSRMSQFSEKLRKSLDLLVASGSAQEQAVRRLRQLLLLQVGDKENFSVDDTVDMLGDGADDSLRHQPSVMEREALSAAIGMLDSIGWRKKHSEWAASDWRLLGFVNDTIQGHHENHERIVERTPILVASEDTWRVLFLVGERTPGPPGLITPHWWRIGLVPLGDGDGLVKDIHFGFRTVLDRLPEERFQLRWWLEEYPNGGGWHDSIGKTDSVQVAAACVAKALSDRTKTSQALLDVIASVSATLVNPDTNVTGASDSGEETPVALEDIPVYGVGSVPTKIQAADTVGLQTLALEASCAKEYEQAKPKRLRVYPVKSFGDVYPCLLETTEVLQEAKNSIGVRFIHIDDLETTSGKHIEVRTHRDFFVSEQDGDQDANLPDASELENDSRFEQAELGVEYFMLRQTVWHAEAADSETLWNLAEREDEPSDEEERGDAGRHPEIISASGGSGKWVRLGGETGRLVGREELVRHALSGSDAWQRVGVVCGAGLGKTTNFEWLASRINRLHNGRGKDFAFFLELNNLPSDPEKLLELILQQMKNVTNRKQHELLKFGVERLLVEGRVTFLADSLDQATQGDPIEALKALMTGRWAKCRVWISGRPYAFRNNRSKLAELATDWNFLRIGQLEEPECRQLLETFKRPSSPPAVPA